MGLHSKLGAGSQPMVKFLVESEALPIYGLRPHQTAFEHMMNAESKFCDAHPERFTIYTRQRVFGVRTEAFGDVILVPSEESDGHADGDKLQAELHLAAEPDVITDDAIFGRVGATFPDFTAV